MSDPLTVLALALLASNLGVLSLGYVLEKRISRLEKMLKHHHTYPNCALAWESLGEKNIR